MDHAGERRILFIGKRFYTNKDTLAERFGRIYQLPYCWAAAGHEVGLWLVDYHTREATQTWDGPLQIVTAPLLSNGMLRTLFCALRFRPHAIVASGDCYIGLLGWTLARLAGACFVFDIYDKYDEFAAYRKPIGFDLFGFLRRRSTLRYYASQVLLRSLEGAEPGPTAVVVPNGVDPQLFVPMDSQICRMRLNLPPDTKLIGYFGSMEPVRGVADLIDAVERLRRQGIEAKALLCGKQHSDTPLDHEAVIFRGLVSHAEVPAYINACDVVALPYRQSALLDNASSCKITEYLMCGRPIVSTRTPNSMENFPEDVGALEQALCAPDDPEGLARAIVFQLRERRVVPPRADLNWRAIAASALLAMESILPQPHR